MLGHSKLRNENFRLLLRECMAVTGQVRRSAFVQGNSEFALRAGHSLRHHGGLDRQACRRRPLLSQMAGRLVLLIAGAALLGCGDYEIPLQRNYIIARTSSNIFIVVAPDRHVVLGPSVDLYAQHDGLLIGRVVDEASPPSYFVLDMNSGGLTTWKEELL